MNINIFILKCHFFAFSTVILGIEDNLFISLCNYEMNINIFILKCHFCAFSTVILGQEDNKDHLENECIKNATNELII